MKFNAEWDAAEKCLPIKITAFFLTLLFRQRLWGVVFRWGAIGTRGRATGVLGPGDHGTTYGSNPLATAAVSAVFTLYKKYGILSHVTTLAAYLDQALKELAEKKASSKKFAAWA